MRVKIYSKKENNKVTFVFQKDHWWAAGRIDGRGRETLDSASQIIIPLNPMVFNRALEKEEISEG